MSYILAIWKVFVIWKEGGPYKIYVIAVCFVRFLIPLQSSRSDKYLVLSKCYSNGIYNSVELYLNIMCGGDRTNVIVGQIILSDHETIAFSRIILNLIIVYNAPMCIKWLKRNIAGLCTCIAPKALHYLAFQSFYFERTWWRLFQKCVVRTKFDIYVFISLKYWERKK